jgi:hypothetical protein
LEDCKAKFKIAWARIRAGLTDRNIAKARELETALGRPADSHVR